MQLLMQALFILTSLLSERIYCAEYEAVVEHSAVPLSRYHLV